MRGRRYYRILAFGPERRGGSDTVRIDDGLGKN
jgi:hypothetical protein